MTSIQGQPSKAGGVLQRIVRSVLFRFLAFAVVLVGLFVALQIGIGLGLKQAPKVIQPPLFLAAELAYGAVMLLGYRLAVRVLERRPAAELALDRTWKLSVPGLLLGAALFTGVYSILRIQGVASEAIPGGFDGAMAALAAALASAVGEEILFRGVAFRLVEEGPGTLAAIVFSAALFGLAHGLNRGATAFSTAAIALEAGVLLGVAYAATRSLWFPIGLHFGWNFTEGGVFGAAVSGGQAHGMLNFKLTGSALMTGGAFGPEASIVAVGVCLLAALVLGGVVVVRGEWRSLPLGRRRPSAA